MILKYKIFENIQQADKWLKGKENTEILSYYERLKQIIIANKLQPLAFTFIKYYDQTKNLDEIFEYLNKIIQFNLKIDINNPKFQSYEGMKEEVNYMIMKIDVMKFIEKFVPGFLKKEMKNPEMIKKLGALIPNIKDEEKLRGMIALFKTADEYINYLEILTKVSNLEELKKSNDIKIIEETDKYIIYSPQTYEAANIIIFNEWSTINRKQYTKYINNGMKIYIYYDKKDIKKSYVIMFNDYDFYACDYHNRMKFNADNYEDKVFKINKVLSYFVDVVREYDKEFDDLISEIY